jgi:hypothetical protein
MNTWRQPYNDYSITRDWNQTQGYTHPSDEHIQIRADINVRHVSIENSSERPIGVAITTYYQGPLPNIQFVLNGGELKSVGINTIGGPMQFIHILDPQTKMPVGSPTAFRTDCNSFVLRDGLNKWYVQFFKTTGFRAAH